MLGVGVEVGEWTAVDVLEVVLRLVVRREGDAGERVWQVWTLTPLIPSDLVADPVGAGGQGFHVCVRELVER